MIHFRFSSDWECRARAIWQVRRNVPPLHPSTHSGVHLPLAAEHRFRRSGLAGFWPPGPPATAVTCRAVVLITRRNRGRYRSACVRGSICPNISRKATWFPKSMRRCYAMPSIDSTRLSVFYFSEVDQESHLLCCRLRRIAEDLSKRDLDIGMVLDQAGIWADVIVMFGPRFAPFNRGVNLNSWLWREGLLAGDETFASIDWQRTKA